MRAANSVAESHRDRAVIGEFGRINAFARRAFEEGRSFVPEQIVHPDLQGRLRAPGSSRANVGERGRLLELEALVGCDPSPLPSTSLTVSPWVAPATLAAIVTVARS